MKKFFMFFGFCFLIFFCFRLDSFADSKSVSIASVSKIPGSGSDQVYLAYHNISITSDYPIKCAFGYNYSSYYYSFVELYVSLDYGSAELHYDLSDQVVYRTFDGVYVDTRTFTDSYSTSYYHTDNGRHYYNSSLNFTWDDSHQDVLLASVSGCPFVLRQSSTLWDYLFNSESDFPDFSEYEYDHHIYTVFGGFPFGYQLDAGVSWLSLLRYYYYGSVDTDGDSVLIQFIGSEDMGFVVPNMSSSDFGWDFQGTYPIGSLCAPDSVLYISVTGFNSVDKTYGDTTVFEYEIGESFIGKLIRSFGSDNYYSATLNVNGNDKTINNIVSVPTFTTTNPPSRYSFDYYNNYNKYYDETYYFPTFDDSSNLSDDDIIIIIDDYIKDTPAPIEENVNNEFNFNFNINDVSAGEIQKMYDDTTGMFSVIANLFALIAGLFSMCFPFLMFDIPGWLLLFGGLLIIGAGVGVFIKIVKFLRG